jgi:hypothetical protein
MSDQHEQEQAAAIDGEVTPKALVEAVHTIGATTVKGFATTTNPDEWEDYAREQGGSEDNIERKTAWTLIADAKPRHVLRVAQALAFEQGEQIDPVLIAAITLLGGPTVYKTIQRTSNHPADWARAVGERIAICEVLDMPERASAWVELGKHDKALVYAAVKKVHQPHC